MILKGVGAGLSNRRKASISPVTVKPVSPVLFEIFNILPQQPQHAFHTQIELDIAFNEYLYPVLGRLIANFAIHEGMHT
jgi:hypothetical protein